MLRSVVLLLLLSLALCACNDDRSRNEAMLFLDRYDEFDVDDPLEERRAAINEIRGLALSDEDVLRARDACADAYGALIEAEDLHASARDQLGVATTTDGQLPADISHQIETAIEQSGQALERSRSLLPRCTREVHALETRFHHRRS